ncbi:MAG: M48 family metallopeptidase [Helicobacter sp.]|nr:M48 family metallopeptidase [Helicobacter sp.]
MQKRNFRHLRMRFGCDSALIVNLPRYTTQRVCEEFIQTNIQWILTHFERSKQEEARIPLCQFYLFGQWVEFETLQPYLDTGLESNVQKALQKWNCGHLQEIERDSTNLVQRLWQAIMQEESESDLQDTILKDIKSKAKLQSLLVAIYQRALESYVSLCIGEISQKMQLFPHRITYGRSYRQLGCCKTKEQSIRLSLRLALMPQFCIHSVIIHELAHLRYPNHQRDFWNLVRTFDSNPKGINAWLRTNASLNAQLYRRIFK